MTNSKMKLTSKILCLGLILVMTLGMLCACDKGDKFDNKYNAVLYESMVDSFNEAYLSANSTHGIYSPEYAENDTRPHTITNVISNKDEFNAAFKEFPTDVDFDKEMIIVHFFTISYIWCKSELKNVSTVLAMKQSAGA